MITPGSSPELIKLGHVLGVAPEQLAALDGLADVPAQDLRTLRRQIGEALFRADKQHFAKVAALSKAVPTRSPPSSPSMRCRRCSPRARRSCSNHSAPVSW